jgi:ATP-dependent RNA helicase DDX21
MTKRISENNISEFEESGKKLLKDLNSESAKVEKSEFHEKSELTHFIKNDKMVQVLKDKGIKRFFPVQYETFEHIFNGKDLIARDRTGSGKTLAFSLPVIERFRKNDAFRDGGKLKFLIVLPTRELAIQVKTEIHSLRVRGDF